MSYLITWMSITGTLVIYNYSIFIYSTHIPDKIIDFNEFDKILLRENSKSGIPKQTY